MNVRPGVFFCGGSIAKSASVFSLGSIDQGTFISTSGICLYPVRKRTRCLIYAIASCLLPWVFPVSGIPDAGTGASLEHLMALKTRQPLQALSLEPCYPLVGFRRLGGIDSRPCRSRERSLAGPSAYSASDA
jgi:hypothetical protein